MCGGFLLTRTLMSYDPYDLTQHAPRSPRVRIGGMVILARMLDKCRADLKGKVGDYEYGCSLDQSLLNFIGIDAAALRVEVAKGKGDGDVLAWIREHATQQRLPHEFDAFNQWHEKRTATTPDRRLKMNTIQTSTAAGAARDDVASWFDLLDMDDHASFGGKI